MTKLRKLLRGYLGSFNGLEKDVKHSLVTKTYLMKRCKVFERENRNEDSSTDS